MDETVPPVGEPRYFSIMVLGEMTPSIHFPYWYALNGFFSDDESKIGMSNPDLVVTADYSRFSIDRIRITCERGRWEIACFDNNTRPRILAIACGVFEKLTETPVTGYGFNSFADLDTKASIVNDILADLGVSTALGFAYKGVRTCEFSFGGNETEKSQTSGAVVRPSAVRPSAVWVAYNNSYKIDENVSPYFNLSPALSANYAEHWEEAKQMGNRVIARINHLVEAPVHV